MIVKNQKLTLTCERLGAELEGVCRYDGLTVFVPGALPGETLDALVVQVRPQYAFGKLLSLKTISPDRQEPFCPVYAQCGGCSGQHMDMTVAYYEATAEAQRTLAAIDATLAEHAADTLDAIGWQALLQAHGAPGVTVTEDKAFTFTVDAGAQRVLEVGGLLTPDQPVRYTLTRHQLVNTGTLETPALNLLWPEQTVAP